MKFYDCTTAPSPRRVRIFMTEKGITLPTVQVNLRAGEQFSPAYRAINPQCVVPFLVLDDGTGIGEAAAICHYLEEIHPEPPLMGSNAKSRGVIAMWDHRMEAEGVMAAGEVLRNTSPGMKNRALSGAHEFAQIPALVERGRARLRAFFADLDARLSESEFIAGPGFTVADITALVAVDFADWVKHGIADTQSHLRRWHQAVSARPSAKA